MCIPMLWSKIRALYFGLVLLGSKLGTLQSGNNASKVEILYWCGLAWVAGDVTDWYQSIL
jgi:hypothetical protein